MDQSKNSNPNRGFPPHRPRGTGPMGPPQNNPPQKKKTTSSLESSDTIEVSNQAGPSRKQPPPVMARNLGEDPHYAGPSETVKLEDGTKIVKYSQPQKLTKLLKDAKAQLGGESSRFFGKGFVIGDGVAKIAPDGKSITYYPPDIGDLVRDLLGPDSETI